MHRKHGSFMLQVFGTSSSRVIKCRIPRIALKAIALATLFHGDDFAQAPGSNTRTDGRSPSNCASAGRQISEYDDTVGPRFGEAFISRQQRSIVTLNKLSHHVPGRAAREYERAHRDLDKGSIEKAIPHLETAIAIDPDFSAALNDLGTSYIMLRRVDSAIEQLTKAIAVDPHAAMPHSNLALAYLQKHQYAEAERLARRAVALDQTWAHGMLILGISLVLDGKFTTEAELSLTIAADQFALANFWLAVGRFAKGDFPAAKDRLRAYLACGDKRDIDLFAAAKSLLERLEFSDGKIR